MRVDMMALREDLAKDDDLFACVTTSCRHLDDAGYELLSVYFERSGRLRCYGSHGYWQILDGFPPSAGVIATTVRRGVSHLVDARTSATYLEAAPNAVSEACAPVFVHGESAGAVNIESSSPLTVAAVEDAEAVATCLSERIEQLGGLPRVEGWHLVAEAANRVQASRDPRRIAATAMAMALDLADTDSGMLVLTDETVGHRVEIAVGPLAAALRSLSEECLGRIDRWVDGPLSCYSVGEPDGQGFTGQDTLRMAGVQSLAVSSLSAGDDRLGFLLLADESPEPPPPALVEQLELLASLTASSLANARRVALLEDQSRRDPLTGLGHSRAFDDRLQVVQRHQQHLHAVLSIDVDHFKEINDTYGHQAGDRMLRALAQSMSAAMRGEDCLFRTGGDEFAAIVAVSDEHEAHAVAKRLQHAARYVDVEVSIGVALTDPGEGTHESVFARADAALYEVKRSGRGAVRIAEPAQPDGAHATAS